MGWLLKKNHGPVPWALLQWVCSGGTWVTRDPEQRPNRQSLFFVAGARLGHRRSLSLASVFFLPPPLSPRRRSGRKAGASAARPLPTKGLLWGA